jgi:hypothetical protein
MNVSKYFKKTFLVLLQEKVLKIIDKDQSETYFF